MNIQELVDLINAHSEYCLNEYSVEKLSHMGLNEALKFQNNMMQSLTHFAMWLSTIYRKVEK